MKELKYAVLGIAFLLGGCQSSDVYYEEDSSQVIGGEIETETPVPGAEVKATAIPAKIETPVVKPAPAPQAKEEKVEVENMRPDTNQPMEKLAYDSAYDRFLDNVVIKARADNYIIYEYKDARVDELAPLASRYCKEHNGRTAVLRSVVLYKNYARRATFDCLSLQ